MTDVDEFIGGLSKDIADLTRELRAFVKLNAPGSTEKLQPGWKCITYVRRTPFCSIVPHAKWVNLQFQSGAELSDSARLLLGSGKAMRHVTISDETNLTNAVAQLVAQASQRAE